MFEIFKIWYRCFVYTGFHVSPQKKSKGFLSGEPGDKDIGASLLIQRSGNLALRKRTNVVSLGGRCFCVFNNGRDAIPTIHFFFARWHQQKYAALNTIFQCNSHANGENQNGAFYHFHEISTCFYIFFEMLKYLLT